MNRTAAIARSYEVKRELRSLQREVVVTAGLVAAFLLCLALYGRASAQEVVVPPGGGLPVVQVLQPAPAPAGVGDALLGLLTPANLAGAVGLIATLVGGLAFLTTRRKRFIANLIHRGYQFVNDEASADGVENNLDKGARFLEVLDQQLAARGWRPLNSSEQASASFEAKALHGAEKVQAKIAVVAATAAVAARAESLKPPAVAPVAAADEPSNPS